MAKRKTEEKAGEKEKTQKPSTAGVKQKTVYEGPAPEVQAAIEDQAQARAAVEDPPEAAEEKFAEIVQHEGIGLVVFDSQSEVPDCDGN